MLSHVTLTLFLIVNMFPVVLSAASTVMESAKKSQAVVVQAAQKASEDKKAASARVSSLELAKHHHTFMCKMSEVMKEHIEDMRVVKYTKGKYSVIAPVVKTLENENGRAQLQQQFVPFTEGASHGIILQLNTRGDVQKMKAEAVCPSTNYKCSIICQLTWCGLAVLNATINGIDVTELAIPPFPFLRDIQAADARHAARAAGRGQTRVPLASIR